MDVPASVSGALGRRSHVPVVGTADGVPLPATLVPVGEGRHRLFLNGQLRRAIGKGPGDRVEIRVHLDTSDRMPALPADLEEALQAHDASVADAGRPGRHPASGGLSQTRARRDALASLRRRQRKEKMIMYYITEHRVSVYLAVLRRRLSATGDPRRATPTIETNRGGAK